MNIDLIKVAKWIGLGLTLAGTAVSAIAGNKDNERILKKFVDEQLKPTE